MKTRKIVYWVATILFCGVFIYSASMYFMKTEMVQDFYKSLNYPEYLVIPSAIVKILAVIIVLTRFSHWLTEWAYAGLFFDLILASSAHYNAGHNIGLSVYTIPFLFISYFLGKQLR